ncbi:uncharacterized protein V6R79_023779 [Siganus canaliculatus]
MLERMSLSAVLGTPQITQENLDVVATYNNTCQVRTHHTIFCLFCHLICSVDVFSVYIMKSKVHAGFGEPKSMEYPPEESLDNPCHEDHMSVVDSEEPTTQPLPPSPLPRLLEHLYLPTDMSQLRKNVNQIFAALM